MKLGIWYEDVVNLGFEVEGSVDCVYYKQYGRSYVIVHKHISPHFIMDWNEHTLTVSILQMDDDSNIIGGTALHSVEQVEEILELRKKHKKKKFEKLMIAMRVAQTFGYKDYICFIHKYRGVHG
ncbi:hypothetical protein JEZ13_04255 [bacterium]|nr:hypothetical protein [bacterium]MBI9072927.1 hypothetical protein [Melioribacteraceae bacterium]